MAKTKCVKVTNPFEDAINNTPDVKGGYLPGLKALRGTDRSCIAATDTRLLNGSLDIDSMVSKLYPSASRWDYAISYNNKVCFVEVHPAQTHEIPNMINKVKWLKNWLKDKAASIESLPSYTPRYVWIASGKCNILPNSQQARQLPVNGLSFPCEKLHLK